MVQVLITGMSENDNTRYSGPSFPKITFVSKCRTLGQGMLTFLVFGHLSFRSPLRLRRLPTANSGHTVRVLATFSSLARPSYGFSHSGVNQITIVGNVGSAPELSYSQNSVPFCRFSVAVNEQWKAEGEKRERVTWFPV
jgi:hypothetical protein